MQSHSEGNPPQLWSFIPPRTRDTDLEAVRLSFRGRKKPVRRATQREEAARNQKKARDEDRTLVFVDESGFYLLPFVMRTYGPRGDTPIIKEFLTRDHLSAISGITPDSKLYMMVQDRAYKSPDVVDFLEHLLKHIPGKLLIVWDRSPIHRSHVIRSFRGRIASGAAA